MRGFTLIEIIVVLVIVGVLATLGFTNYARMIEKSRGAEARAILGNIRTQAAAYRLETGAATNFTAQMAGIGGGDDQIPDACSTKHYFSYSLLVNPVVGDKLEAKATRCTAGGKAPQASAGFTLILTSDFTAGTDVWSGTGGY